MSSEERITFGGDGTEGLAKTAAGAGKATDAHKDAAERSLRRAKAVTNHLTGELEGGNTMPGLGRGEK